MGILQINQLFLKLLKCFFYVDTVTYLGIVVTPEGVSMEKEKIKVIEEWKDPWKIKELQAFLGFVNFYRCFVKDFSFITKPLTRLTGKDIPWAWGEEEKRAFNQLKMGITKDPVLVHPNRQLPYILETDTSSVAIGAILSQKQSDGHLHPIAYMSQSFSKEQNNYDTRNKELLAITTAFEHWQLFLEGTEEPVTVYTNHRNLEYWMHTRKFGRRHQRWHHVMSQCDAPYLFFSLATLSTELRSFDSYLRPHIAYCTCCSCLIMWLGALILRSPVPSHFLSL